MKISRIKRSISTRSGKTYTTMSITETVDYNGNRIKFEWATDSTKLVKVTDADGRVATRSGENCWKILDEASGAVEYQFDGEIRVSEDGTLTVKQWCGPDRKSESTTLSLDGTITRRISTVHKGSQFNLFTQWSQL